MKARYKVEGSAADGQTWTIEGNVSGELPDILTTAIHDSFGQLTGGKAVFGHPGLGCRGPYKVARFELVVL
jgi:hypothetical protein